jgi:PAP2 superfamily
VLRVWVVVALFATVTVTRSHQVGIPLRDPHGEILRTRLAISAALFAVLALVDAVVRARRRGSALSEVGAVLRDRWPVRRLVLTWSGLLAYHTVYFCYHNLKSWDVLNRPRDAMLLRWDRALFLGHSPAVLLHEILGQHLAAYLLLGIYESFSWLVSVSFVAALVLTDRVREGYVFIASAICVWILGLCSYYSIPSLGPFWSAPRDFAGLPHTMVQDTQARYLAQRAFLLAHPHAPDAFAQVSAFASLHIGVSTVILLMAHYYRMRLVTRVLGLYLVGTLLATVYLGWHFALDDVAGLLIGALAVCMGRLIVHPRQPPAPWRSGPAGPTRTGATAQGLPPRGQGGPSTEGVRRTGPLPAERRG